MARKKQAENKYSDTVLALAKEQFMLSLELKERAPDLFDRGLELKERLQYMTVKQYNEFAKATTDILVELEAEREYYAKKTQQ